MNRVRRTRRRIEGGEEEGEEEPEAEYKQPRRERSDQIPLVQRGKAKPPRRFALASVIQEAGDPLRRDGNEDESSRKRKERENRDEDEEVGWTLNVSQ